MKMAWLVVVNGEYPDEVLFCTEIPKFYYSAKRIVYMEVEE